MHQAVFMGQICSSKKFISRFPVDGCEFWSWPEVIGSYPLGFNWVTGVTSDP